MRCITCLNFSFAHVCNVCQNEFFTPKLIKTIFNPLLVYSFYYYKDVGEFIKTKHSYMGYYILNIMGKNSFALFKDSFSFPYNVSIVPIDDNTKHGYSHTAILAKMLKSKKMAIEYGSLIAKNSITYSNRPLEFRIKNSRDFRVGKIRYNDVILVDDIVTTGTTLKEAYYTLKLKGYNILFALTLAKV